MSEQSSERQVWNKADALARLMNNETLVAKVAAMYVSTTPDQLDSLKTAIGQGNCEETTAIAHTLKGASANLGGEQMADLCAAIEQAAKDGNPVLVSRLAIELDATHQRLLAALG
jgi:two-component system sensor histidine kinase/response regulator